MPTLSPPRSRKHKRKGPQFAIVAIVTAALMATMALTARSASAAPGDLAIATGGPVTVTIGVSSAAFTTELGLYSAANPSSRTVFIGTNRQTGTVVNLGTFPAGQELIFGIYVRDTGQTYFTGPAGRNPDGRFHADVRGTGAGTADIGFEDTFGGGDSDFNDHVFHFVGIIPDATPPVITGSRTPPPNPNGWNNTPVTVSFTCTDDRGVAAVTPPTTLSMNGANQSVTGTCTDTSGNSASTTVGNINIDLTPPVLTAGVTPPANAAGWNNSPVTVTFMCSDALSGVALTTPPVTLSTDGADQSASGTCMDRAGNSTTRTVTGISIDQQDPAITGSRTPAANANGWNNSPVTVSFTCTDTLSGIASCTGPSTLNEGAGQSVTGTATDVAGNTATATVSNINVDLTNPLIVATATSGGQPYTAGAWTNQDVFVSFTCTDALSGVATVTSPVTLSGEGDNLSATGTCTDKAGNAGSITFGPVKIDKSAPVFRTCRASTTSLWPANHKLHAVTVDISLDATGSSASFVLVSATSNEPDNGLGDGDTPGDLQGWTTGAPDTSGELRAERSGGGSGRVYTLTYQATDQAGNVATCALQVKVAHDQGNEPR